ncbi:hypothetical protein SAMN03080615_01585 [Amphritea atlantica]|uniref:Uncharacterized protein n=1 Tax=Amphritea atlantica TaxID=355243 RepID=A0A1H9GBE3_9GAMM|nr:hypothetical protein [Amphritea atlantica]SEQ47380.1 hypothetical protein SAMN03080615_01585 [Amphritea atlantica]
MSETAVARLIAQFGPLLEASLEAASVKLTQAGFGSVLLPSLRQFQFETRKEPLNGDDTLNGRWADSNSQRRGWLVINCDGSMMLEIDLICPWPDKQQVWAESVSVWGSDPQRLSAEVTPMQML